MKYNHFNIPKRAVSIQTGASLKIMLVDFAFSLINLLKPMLILSHDNQ